MSGKYSTEIPIGTDWARTITQFSDSARTLPEDLSGYTARMDIRRKPSSDNFLIQLTTGNGGITLGGALGTIALVITSADSVDFPPGAAVGHLEMIDASGLVTRLLEFNLTLTAEVTR